LLQFQKFYLTGEDETSAANKTNFSDVDRLKLGSADSSNSAHLFAGILAAESEQPMVVFL